MALFKLFGPIFGFYLSLGFFFLCFFLHQTLLLLHILVVGLLHFLFFCFMISLHSLELQTTKLSMFFFFRFNLAFEICQMLLSLLLSLFGLLFGDSFMLFHVPVVLFLSDPLFFCSVNLRLLHLEFHSLLEFDVILSNLGRKLDRLVE